jgi:hypothetical protein
VRIEVRKKRRQRKRSGRKKDVENNSHIYSNSLQVPQLTKDDRGFGDSGFRFTDETKERYPITKEFRIYTPTGSHNSKQYQIFSSHRILVENKLADLKQWECLKQVVREKIKGNEELLEQQTKKWMTVGGLDVWKTDGYQEL